MLFATGSIALLCYNKAPYLFHMQREEEDKNKICPNVLLRMKIQRMNKKWRKLAKLSKLRYNKLKEWSTSEETYLNRLKVLRDQVEKPLLQAGMISEYQEQIIFPNLESMIQLGEEMKKKIDGLLSTWNPINTLLSPIVEELSIYLKIYKDYSNNFKKADAMIQTLKQDPKFKQVVKVDYVEDYLIKPVQRPLQYKLFVSDYLHALPKYHKDYANLQKALNVLLKIAEEINDYVEQQMRAQKMVLLEKTFGDIIQSTRVYKTQLQANVFDIKVRVYVLNDLLLVSKFDRGKDEQYMKIYLDGSSYIMKQDNTKSFKNRLYICGMYESVHLNFDCQDDLNRAYDMISSLIADLYQKEYNRQAMISKMKARRETFASQQSQKLKWKEHFYHLKLEIKVLNIEKRYLGKEWKIIVVVQIKIPLPFCIYQIAFYEISDFRGLEKHLKSIYPNLKLPSLDAKYKGFSSEEIKTDFQKYVEYRAVLIQDFLNFVLRCKEVSTRPEFVLYKLKLNECLWQYLNKFELDCNCESCLRSEIYTNMDFYRKQQISIRKKQYPFCILKSFNTQNSISELVPKQEFSKFTIEQKLIWATCKQKQIDYGLLIPPNFGHTFKYTIHLTLVSEEVNYIGLANTNSTVREVIAQICEKQGVFTTRDLILVYVLGPIEYYLDDDEYLWDILKNFEENLAESAAEAPWLSKTFDNFGEVTIQEGMKDAARIYLRKVYTFPLNQEEKICQENFERYPIVLGEMLVKFKSQALLLNISDIKVFCALFYSVDEFNMIIFSKNFTITEKKLKKYLPESKWSLISLEFKNQIKAIIDQQIKFCDNISLLYRCILKQFGERVGWRTHFFIVENIDSSTLLGSSSLLQIGVNCDRVIVTRQYNSAQLLSFPIESFGYRIYGSSLFIDTEEKTFQFSGSNLLLFDNMVKKYKLIKEFETS